LVPAAQLIYRARATMVLLMMQKWLASAAVSIARQREQWAGMPCRYAWSLATGAAGFGRSNAAKSGAVLVSRARM
jgi:hypothetical protein